jgi:hypothetical protein
MSIGAASHVDVSSDVAVKASAGLLVGVLLAAGSTATSLILYDNAEAASGTVLAKLTAVANGASVQFVPSVPYAFANGCYADITGTGANATVVVI